MKLDEIFSPYVPMIGSKPILLEGIDHPEDLIMKHGSAGAERVVREFIGLQQDSGSVSIKWDGFPALVFGRDAQGDLVLVDKHMYDKIAKGKMEFTTITDYDRTRGSDRNDLWEKEMKLRELLEQIVPNVKDQYWMGDLMWVGVPKTQDGSFVFRPNTVEYQVRKDSDLGRQIINSQAGIAVHTIIPALGAVDEPLRGLNGLPEDRGIVFLTGEVKDRTPTITVDKKFLRDAQSVIKKYGHQADDFIQKLQIMKAKMVLTAMGPFITHMLDSGDIKRDIVSRFLDFLKSKLSSSASARLIGNDDGWLYQSDGGAPGLLAIWKLWGAVTDLKLHVKKQLDDQINGGVVKAIIDGANSHEGYVFGIGNGKLKIVDRLGFSAANFAKHRVSSDEIADRESMPLAAFCFGRMNPPTLGHEMLMDTVMSIGGSNSYIFLSGSVNGEKDPLDLPTKRDFIKKIYPKFSGHIVNDPVLNPIYAANYLYRRGYRHMVFVAGSDRLGDGAGSIEKLLQSWNSGPVRARDNQFGPDGREFVLLKFVSSGDRDPESDDIRGYSGSKARAAAAAGNEKLFWKYTGVSPRLTVHGQDLYQATRKGLGITDKEVMITELKDLDTTKYGGWINARDGKISYVEDGETHKDVANRSGADMQSYEDYSTAYDLHLVRFLQNLPIALELSGNQEDIQKTFRLWWPTAVKALMLYVDIADKKQFSSFDMLDPRKRMAARQLFGPKEISEDEVYE